MPTAVGPWQGSTPNARIEIDYNVTRSADGTSASMSGTVIIASNQSLVDSTNSWQVWGGAGDASGSGIGINHGSGGGRTGFCSISAGIGPGGLDIGARVTGLQGPGATIEAVLHLDGVSLAPYTDGSYSTYNVGPTGFTVGGFVANGNGGTLTDVQAQVNTSPQEAGATIFQPGSFVDVNVPGRVRDTTYHYRVRLANNTFGWGPWGPWKSVRTAKTAPSAPFDYAAFNITATSVQTNGITVSDFGSEAGLVGARGQINTTASETGATVVTRDSWGNVHFNGLVRDTTYYFRIAASNGYAWSAYGEWVSFRTAKTAPSAPFDYGAFNITQTSVQTNGISVLDLGSEAGLVDARGQINKTASETGATVVTRGSWGNVAFNDLDPGTTYYFRIAASNGYAWSAYGGWVAFTTLPGVMVKHGGAWRNAIPYVKVGGIWKQATRYVKVSGAWR